MPGTTSSTSSGMGASLAPRANTSAAPSRHCAFRSVSRFGSSSHSEITVIASAANPGVRRGRALAAKRILDCFGALRALRNDKCLPDVVKFGTSTLDRPSCQGCLRASSAMAISEAPPNTMSMPTRRPSAQTSVPGKPEMTIPARTRSMTPFTIIHSHLPDS